MNKASYENEMPSVLTEIAHSAKSHWAYPKEWIASWRDDLTVTEKEILTNITLAIKKQDAVIGFTMLMRSAPHFSIEHFWILPKYIGLGYGKLLMNELLSLNELKGSTIQVLADPNAEAFYQKCGFHKMAYVPSSIPGRSLPLMELKNA